jgi:hypothetical protein
MPTTSSCRPLSTIAWANGTDLSVVNCELAMIGELSAVANVTAVTASRVRITGCRISTPGLGGHVSVAWGGIHLINVYDVELADNHIEDGLGHGITFGVYFTTSPPDDIAWFDPGGRFEIDTTNDCPNPEADMPLGVPPVGGGPDIEVLPSYNQNIRILRNRISGMGGSGISVLGFWPDTADPYPMIETHDLVIDGNIIENNYRTPPQAALTPEYIDVVAFGGIALAAADRLQVRDNLIQNNGADFRAPACGIYVLTGENIAIENNLIRNNGPRIADTALSGIRAGIALQLVGRHIAVDGDVELDSLLPAARIRGKRRRTTRRPRPPALRHRPHVHRGQHPHQRGSRLRHLGHDSPLHRHPQRRPVAGAAARGRHPRGHRLLPRAAPPLRLTRPVARAHRRPHPLHR